MDGHGLGDGGRRMAEREGFEPPVAFRLRLISSQVHSTGLCHLSQASSYQNSYLPKTAETVTETVSKYGKNAAGIAASFSRAPSIAGPR